jgi:hypothetical protein
VLYPSIAAAEEAGRAHRAALAAADMTDDGPECVEPYDCERHSPLFTDEYDAAAHACSRSGYTHKAFGEASTCPCHTCTECDGAQCAGLDLCPHCGRGVHDYHTSLVDHGKCTDCHKAWQLGEEPV